MGPASPLMGYNGLAVGPRPEDQYILEKMLNEGTTGLQLRNEETMRELGLDPQGG